MWCHLIRCRTPQTPPPNAPNALRMPSYMTEDGGVVCGKCGAMLELELTEIAPG